MYPMVIRSVPTVSRSDHPQWTVLSPSRGPIACQPATNRSWSWFHWSCSGLTWSSQYHWTIAVSTRPGGLSAWKPSSLGGEVPSYQRSRQLYRLGAYEASERRSPGAAQSGMPNSGYRLFITTYRAAATNDALRPPVAALGGGRPRGARVQTMIAS